MANLLYNLAQPFSDTKQYTQGAIVIYNDRMYEMTADEYTPGPFDPEKFTERFLSEMMSGKLNSNLNKFDIDNIETNNVNGSSGVKSFTLNKGVYIFVNDTGANQGVSVQSNSYKIFQDEETDKQQVIIVEVTSSSESITMTPNYSNDYWSTRYFKIL